MSNIVINIPSQQQGGYQQQQQQQFRPQPQPGFQQPGFQPQPQYQPQPQFQPQPGFQQPGFQPQPQYQPQPQFQPQPNYQQQPMVQPQQFPPQQQPVLQQNNSQPAPTVTTNAQGKKGWERLDRDGIFIRQHVDILEALTGCEQGNTYFIHPLGKDGEKKGKALMKAKEKSSCFSKQCMSAECRPFQLKISLEDDSEELDAEPFLAVDRPCKCTCMCCSRPEMKVTYVEDGKNEYIGKIVDPMNCCGIQFNIYDANNTMRYKIQGDCCQLGLWCKGPCESCQIIDFNIKTPSGEIVSGLRKKSPGCLSAMVSDADNFSIHFPNNCSKEDKALIMCAVMFIDFRFFEKKGGKKR